VSSHQTGSKSQPRKRLVKTVASLIVSVLGAECGLRAALGPFAFGPFRPFFLL
jgi:hypothetical protein